MTTADQPKHEKVIAEYYQEMRERSRILEKSRINMEQILEKRREIEKNRELENEIDCKGKETGNEETETKVQHLTMYPDEFTQQNNGDLVEEDLKYNMEDIFIDETDLANNDDADIEEDEEDAEFALWLRSISQCLSGKISKEPVRPASPESDEEEEEEEEEDVRCMRVVKSVFDEDSATILVKSYLKYSKVIFINQSN